MKQPSRRITIISSCCLIASTSFLYKVQHILDSTQQLPQALTPVRNHNYSQVIHKRFNDKQLWDDLPSDAQLAARTLQWTRDSWDASKDSPLYHLPWNTLSKEQKNAAVVLGVDEDWSRGTVEELDQTAQFTPKEQSDRYSNPPPKPKLQNRTIPLIMRPKNGPPIFHLPTTQTLCKLNKFEVVCSNVTRTSSIEAYPLFAEYYTDGDGTHVPKQNTPQQRPIATDWFRPNATKFCGGGMYQPCANLGDELGPMLLLKLSGQEYIENRYDGMDVVIIGSVLNFIVKKYDLTVGRLGSHYNITVWGTGTKWGAKSVCFDFRAVRGPKTRDKYLQQGCNVPEVYGDPALLFPYIYTPKQLNLKKADLCLVPHMGDVAEDFPWWTELNGTSSLIQRFTYRDHETNGKIVRVIDIRTPDAAAFIDIMMTCKIIASASLHGMILAEAYNLTWSWIRLRDKSEDPFKYNDFFLSVGIDKTSARPLKVKAKDSVDKIIEHTMIPKIRGPSLFDPVKLLDACPFCDPDIVKGVKAVIGGK